MKKATVLFSCFSSSVLSLKAESVSTPSVNFLVGREAVFLPRIPPEFDATRILEILSQITLAKTSNYKIPIKFIVLDPDENHSRKINLIDIVLLLLHLLHLKCKRNFQ